MKSLRVFKTDNIIIQFTAFTLFVVVSVSTLLGVLLTRRMTRETILRHIEIYPQIMESMVKSEPAIIDFLLSKTKTFEPAETAKLFGDLMNYGTVFRIKVWDMNGTIVWSDKQELIGQSFPNNQDFIYAATIGVHYEVEFLDEEEHEFEQDVRTALEIYSPIKNGGTTIGVVELYEDADRLFWTIGRHNTVIWFFIATAGLVIYTLLFLVFLGAHRRQKIAGQHISSAQQAIITCLAHQTEIRDVGTGRHLDRTSAYVRLMIDQLQNDPVYAPAMTEKFAEDLIKATPLHDIGKVGVPDAILCKPGKLSSEEFSIMKKHCNYGVVVLTRARNHLAFPSFLDIAVEVAAHHHERWDGQGYPGGLRGEAIPLSARIMALADVYDALRSERCYKQSLSHEESRAIIADGRGSQFDPHIVAAFLAREEDFKKISEELSD